MSHKIALTLTLCAWLLATGSHWDLLQTFAWVRMTVNHSQTVSWSRAVALTFNSGEMCEVCRAVDDAKQRQTSDSATPSGKAEGKVVLVCEPAAQVFWIAGESVDWPPFATDGLTAERSAPPTPPPRAV
jgi:hypothetical protein